MIIPRLYSAHILLIPAILIGLFTAHIGLVFVQKHTQFPGPGRTNENVVGYPVMPVYAAKAGGFFFIVFGVIALIVRPGADQPDLGLRALRPLPRHRRLAARLVHGLRRRRAAPAARLAGVQRLRLHPVAEHRARRPGAAAAGLHRARRLPVRRTLGHRRQPRAPPARAPAQLPGAHRASAWPASPPTACCLFASGNDIMAIKLGMSINDLTWFFRIGFFVLPPIMFWVTKRICLSLQRRDRDTVLHGRETGTIIRTPDGRFFERHETEAHRRPVDARAARAGRPARDRGRRRRERRRPQGQALGPRPRARLSRFYFADAVNPVTPAELAAAHHHGAEHEAIEPSASGGAAPIEAAEADEIESGEPAGRH